MSIKQLFFALFMGASLLFAVSSDAQIRKIPAAVTDSFKVKYPAATSLEWKDKLTSFQASFTIDNAKYEAKFNSKGEWQSTEKEITPEKLPAPIADGLSKSKYADWKPENAHVLYLPGDKTQYRIEVSKSDIQKKNLLFSNSGRLLKDNITL
jgi:hypothetical protein